MGKLVLVVEEACGGGYIAKAVGAAIVTEAVDTLGGILNELVTRFKITHA